MQLKFYLNKFLKVDNIENYTLGTLKELENIYEDFKNDTDGLDPDFPGISFKTKGTNLIVGSNVYKLMDTIPDPNNNKSRPQPSIEKLPPSKSKQK